MRFVHGCEPAYRFVGLKQLAIMKDSVLKHIPVGEQRAALAGESEKLPSIHKAVRSGEKYGIPFLSPELSLMVTARERQARWEAGGIESLEDAPLALRLLLFCRDAGDGQRINDEGWAKQKGSFAQVFSRAVGKNWITAPVGAPAFISEDAERKLVGSLRVPTLRPVDCEAYAAILKVPVTRDSAFGEAVLREARQDLRFHMSRENAAPTRISRDKSQPVTRETPDPLKTEGVQKENALLQAQEVITHPNLYRRAECTRVTVKALEEVGKLPPSKQRFAARFMRVAASQVFPTTDDRGLAFGVKDLTNIVEHLSNVHVGMGAWCEAFGRVLHPARRHGCGALQRLSIDMVGKWLTRDNLTPEVQAQLVGLLKSQAKETNVRPHIPRALYWIEQNQAKFTDSQLRYVAVSLLTRLSHDYLYHSVYISAGAEREKGNPHTMGALELVLSIARQGRLGVEDAVQCYEAAGRYLMSRDRERSDAWLERQRVETRALMAELNVLFAGEPERRTREILDSLEFARNLQLKERQLPQKTR